MPDVHLCSLTIVLSAGNGNIRLWYNNRDEARAAFAKVNEAKTAAAVGNPRGVTVSDHYSNEVSVDAAYIVAVTLTDVAHDLEANAESSLLQAVANAVLQKRADSDKRLTSGIARAQGALLGQFGGPQ